ncbi:hypothetical protein [uncultured Roseobacter sp.]|uniref:hypothetical protein n=1 Tax=uncultured Roseobacter sp. TaxID=114847 RepID=UPI00262B4CFD|nr:hypothetical protein [uncultured Roseobacter sp.]
MTYQEMLSSVLILPEGERRRLMRAHWRDAFSDGFIAYVQSQIDATEAYIRGEKRGLSAWLPDMVEAVFVEGNKVYLGQLLTVWESMKVVYAQLQAASAEEGNPTGMAARASGSVMPAGQVITGAGECARCGAAAQAGICDACADHDAFIEQEHVEYERQLNDQEYYRQQYDNHQADASYYDGQSDFYNSQ